MLRKQQDINNALLWALLLISGVGYYFLGYQTERTSFTQLLGIFAGLFFCYFFIYKYWNKNYISINAIGILFRIILVAAIPKLSDDIYRFLWDGQLFASGENPYIHIPTEAINLGIEGINQSNLAQLNSPEYYTVYPPFLQYCFGLTQLIFPFQIEYATLFLKCLIILAEIGSIFLITKLLISLDIDPKYATLYSLNPLVIVELTGNVHFEAFLIFFLLLSIYMLQKQKLLLSASSFALAVSSKLLPLMFLPLLIRRVGIKKSLIYFSLVLLLNLILFIPFVSESLFINLFSSVELYFQKFEFNASIYYLIRWIGFKIAGYNIIQIAGIALPLLTTLIIAIITLKEERITAKNIPVTMLIILTLFFLFSTTVHPWYLTTLIALTPFVKSRFAIIWSATVILSYYCYSIANFEENMWLIALEYLVVLTYLFWEWRTDKV